MCIMSVEPLRRGVASNTNYFGVDFGNFIGPVAAGLIISRFGFLSELSPGWPGGGIISPLYLIMIVPVILAMAVFALGWKPYTRRLALRNLSRST